MAIADRLDEEGQGLAERIGRADGAASYRRADVARESDVERVGREIGDAFGRIDVLVNNAGISGANKPTHEFVRGRMGLVKFSDPRVGSHLE